MAIEITKQETEEIIHSLKRYFSSELDQELSDLKAKFLLDYILKEISPLAYNLGVKHSEEYFRARLEDLSATVFEPALAYWRTKRK